MWFQRVGGGPRCCERGVQGLGFITVLGLGFRGAILYASSMCFLKLSTLLTHSCGLLEACTSRARTRFAGIPS